MRVAVFGLGYVGAVSAAALAEGGHEVCAVDVDEAKVSTVAAGRSPVAEPGLDDLIQRMTRNGALRATTSSRQALREAEVSMVCVGTPSTPDGRTDLSYLRRAFEDLTVGLRAAEPRDDETHAVIVRSTVPPGTVETAGRELCRALAAYDRRVGVAMCPEFLREGTGLSDFRHPPYTVIGTDDRSVAARVQELLGFVEAPVRVVTPRTAESLKYACNAYHATKVSFANELGRILRRLHVDSREVMDLFCEDHHLNISSRYLRPGFAFGGSCLPKDLRSLLHLARMESVDLPLLAGALSTNRLCVEDLLERVAHGPGRRIAVIGLSFKAQSDDLRESPYVDVAEALLGKGYEVRIFDPVVNPAELIGSNRAYVISKLPHLRALLVPDLRTALLDADTAIVSYASPEVTDALLSYPPYQVIDLDGRLGQAVEALTGYEGVAW